MAKFWDDFKAFAVKGNFIDMAVGVVIGTAFGKIVTSLVNDIIMPLIGWLCGGVDLSSLKIPLKGNLAKQVVDGTTDIVGIKADAIEKVMTEPDVAYLCYGNFIQEILDFFIIALCIFACIRLVTDIDKKIKAKKATAPATPAAPAAKPDDVVLLEEIRDLLKEQKKQKDSK